MGSEANTLFKALVDAVEDYAIFALDPNGVILTWNAGGRRLKGYTSEEVIGTHFGRFYTETDLRRNHPQNELKLATQNGKYEEEGWRVRKDGGMFWANVVITALKDVSGNLIGFAKVTRDLTEQKKAEEELKRSEERFRLMVETVQDYAIFMLDPSGRIASWNRGAERNKGYRADEIIGSHFSKFYLEEDVLTNKPDRALREALQCGRFEGEGWRVRKDGTTFWASVVITPIYDKSQNLIGFSKVTRDLTERKKAEEALLKSHADLEIRVELRTKELTEQKRVAEEAVRARDIFFSMASHELKTPLSTLKLQTQLRARSVEAGDFSEFAPENLASLVEDDERQVNRLLFLIDNMMDVSKLTAGHFKLHLEKFDFAEMVKATAKRMLPTLTESGNKLSLGLGQPLVGMWDQARVEQVLMNLLANAGKYAPGSDVHVDLVAGEKSLTLSVQDWGPGIPQTEHARLFKPFERMTGDNHAGGLGLGLFITKQIIEAHQGDIEIQSRPGDGTKFVVRLPLNPVETGSRL